MEVAAGEDLLVLGKHQGVVGDRIGLAHQHLGGVADLGQTGPHHLGLAAQGVGILHLLAVVMGHADLAAIHQQVAVAGGGIDLAALTAHLMDAGIERSATAQGGLHAHGTYGDGASEQILGVEQAFQRERRAGLGAVEQRQPLLGCQGDGLQARNLERSGGVDQLALVAGLAFTYQQAAHMGQGRQVAGGADGALLRHHRIDFGVDEGHQGLEHRQADA
ncbi:hypothetical protein D3C84_816190 [compost metagenome]